VLVRRSISVFASGLISTTAVLGIHCAHVALHEAAEFTNGQSPRGGLGCVLLVRGRHALVSTLLVAAAAQLPLILLSWIQQLPRRHVPLVLADFALLWLVCGTNNEVWPVVWRWLGPIGVS
jgi:hypothetical protein